jgi:nicotinamide-nucleotide adenylyltransferase
MDQADLRAALAALSPDGPPEARLVAGSCPRGAALVVLSGSFNPPTRAHVGVAEAALAAGRFDRVLFAIAVRTIDKEHATGASLEERFAMLAALVAAEPRFAAVACNRGLYADQAQAIQAAFAPADLAFVVGYDKIVQILDPRYYVARDAALRPLFARARFLVAPRAGAGEAELRALFARPENRPYADRVTYLPLDALPEAERGLSSTRVRELLARGEDVAAVVPPAVLPVLRRIAAYREGAPG